MIILYDVWVKYVTDERYENFHKIQNAGKQLQHNDLTATMSNSDTGYRWHNRWVGMMRGDGLRPNSKQLTQNTERTQVRRSQTWLIS